MPEQLSRTEQISMGDPSSVWGTGLSGLHHPSSVR